MKKKTIVLCAGGTGGHLFPAQAFAEYLLKKRVNPVLIYDERVESLRAGVFLKIQSKKIKTHRFDVSFPEKTKSALKSFFEILKLRSYLKKLKPEAVIGFGGYASLTAVVAASSLGIKVYLHEQNSVFGKTNRLLQILAEKIFTTFDNTRKVAAKSTSKLVRVGWFVRESIRAIKPSKVTSRKLKILVIGGSQGAKIFTDVIPSAAALLSDDIKKKLEIVQQARLELVEETQKAYLDVGIKATVAGFFDNIADLISGATLVICRAGSSTIGELIVLGKPSILVPLPTSEDAHQYYNANMLEENNAAILMNQQDFTPEELAAAITNLFNDKKQLAILAANAQALDMKNGFAICMKGILK